MRRVVALALALAISCTPTVTGDPPPGSNGAPEGSSATFPRGIYFVQPSMTHPGGTIEVLEGSGPLPRQVSFTGIGYDVVDSFIVTAEDDTLVLWMADGSNRRVRVNGLHSIVRPSVASDGRRVAVQASETRAQPGTPPPATIYVVDLTTGQFTRLGDVPADQSTQSEMPAWIPSTDRVAYWTTEDACLVIKVREVSTGGDVSTIRRDGPTGCYQPVNGPQDGARFHIAAHANGRIFIPGQTQIYNSADASRHADSSFFIRRLPGGYAPDRRFPGQSGGGTYPLSGSLGPDGKNFVFDGAVEKDGAYGLVIMKVLVVDDVVSQSLLHGPIPVNPEFSNNHNFSQLLPRWR